MFPFQQSNEFSFTTPTLTTPQGYQIQDDPMTNNGNSFDNDLFDFLNDKQATKTTDPGLPRPQKRKQKQSKGESSSSKKAMHREIERKRRLEMSNLHASLNSLLPDDGLKAKRSVSDQIHEAALHIKRMEKNIEELKSRRDKLKSLCSGGDSKHDCVTINVGSHGMEILISHSIKANKLGLSPVIAEIHRNQLDVISSVSSRLKECFVHKLHVKARDMINLDLFALKDRLSKVIKQFG